MTQRSLFYMSACLEREIHSMEIIDGESVSQMDIFVG